MTRARAGTGRRWLAASLAAIAVASAAGCAYLDTKQREWIFRAQRDIHSTPASYGLAFEDVWLPVAGDADGARERVHGWWIPGPDAAAPTLLYLHGARRNLSDNLFRIQRFQRMGFAVLAIDYRGFGRSDGELPSEAQAYDDAQAAWQRLRLLEPDPRRRFAYGHSLGGAVAIELATRNDDVAGLIVESTFTSMADMADKMGYGNFPIGLVLTQHFDSLARIGAVKAPVLFVHGTSDRFVPAEMSERLYAAAPEPKRLLLVESGNHSNVALVAFEKYQTAVRDFLVLVREGAGARPRVGGPGRLTASSSLPFLGSDRVHAALDWCALVAEALREAFRVGANAPVRSSYPVTGAGDRLLLMPAWAAGSLGVKVVTVFPGNRARGLASVSALYLLMDGATGHPLALIDGEALTLRRTAAASALAATYLARPDSKRLLVVGTGALAPYMAAAHCAVRPMERVLVWGRSAEHARATTARLVAEGLPAEACGDLAAGLALADIVTCATTAREPIVRGAAVRPGTHVDLVGAFTPEMRESDDALVQRAEVFVDTYAGALKEAGDLTQAIAAGAIGREHVRAELADLVTGRHAGRSAAEAVTLFKSVGTALEDLCAARLVYDREVSPR